MQNEEGARAEQEKKFAITMSTSNSNDWSSFEDDDIMQQQSAIHAQEAGKIHLLEIRNHFLYWRMNQSGSPILLKKIKEYILESQDRAEVDRIKIKVEQCRKTLQNLGYAEFTFEDFFALLLEQLESVLAENK